MERPVYLCIIVCNWKCTLSDSAQRYLVLYTVYHLTAPLYTNISTITNLSFCCKTKSKPYFY